MGPVDDKSSLIISDNGMVTFRCQPVTQINDDEVPRCHMLHWVDKEILSSIGSAQWLVLDYVIKWKFFYALLALCEGFDVFFDLCLKNGWANNQGAGDLSGHRTHYNVAVIWLAAVQFEICEPCSYPCSFGIPGGRFKNTYELLNLRALKFSPVNKIRIFQCMGMIFCVEFQRYPLKFHTKYLTHTLKDVTFIQHWNFKSS